MALLAILLAGCAQQGVVEVPVPVPCLRGAPPARPAMARNDDLKKLDDEKLLLTIAAERLEQGAYASKAQAIIAACTSP